MNTTYTSSERVHAGALIPGLAVILMAAGSVGWGLHTIGGSESFLPVVFSGLAALLVAGVVYLVVDAAHCRNKQIASGLAVVGTVMMLSAPLLIEYLLAGNSESVSAWLANRSNAFSGTDSAESTLRWSGIFSFILDVLMSGYVMIAIARWTAGRGYCESRMQWMSKTRANLPAGVGEPLFEVLRDGQSEALRQLRPSGLCPADERCEVVLEYCPASEETLNHQVAAYLSLYEYKRVRTRRSEGMHPFPIVQQLRLADKQLAALSELFPGVALS